MIDFDDLEGEEWARAEEGALRRAAREASEAEAEEACCFSGRVRGPAEGCRVPLRARADAAAAIVGERRVGELVRLARKEGGWALLHPLELARASTDYQDYWTAILKDEVPRRVGDAWIPLECLDVAAAAASVGARAACESDSLAEDPNGRFGASTTVQETLDFARSSLTIVVSTSAAAHHCDPVMLLRVLESLQANEALRPCRKLVVFDALPDEAQHRSAEAKGLLAANGRHWVHRADERLADAYEQYKDALREALSQERTAMQGVELVFLQEWGHLVGTVRRAMELVTTPFVLLHQHDLFVTRDLSRSHVIGILRQLAAKQVNYVILNRDVNFARRSTQYFQAAPHRPDLWRIFVRRHLRHLHDEARTQLTPIIGYSDQTHFARSTWVRERVLPIVGNRRCCMEFVAHEAMLLAWLHNPASWEKTYMLGGMDEGPFIYDVQKNGICWASLTDTCDSDRWEDMCVSTEDRVAHPLRKDLALSLYVRRSSGESGRALFEFFPDPDAATNRRSREMFDIDGRSQSRPGTGRIFVHK